MLASMPTNSKDQGIPRYTSPRAQPRVKPDAAGFTKGRGVSKAESRGEPDSSDCSEVIVQWASSSQKFDPFFVLGKRQKQ